MSRSFVLREFGGPERLLWEDIEVPKPNAGEVLVRHTAVGVNFSDVYLRTGMYPRALPCGVGGEAAGVVEAVGPKVKGFKHGDRVVYNFPNPGAYAEQRVLPASALCKIPAGVTDEAAAAVLMKGLTSWYLLRQTYRVKRGDVLLVPAASGGVGLILTQWARALGATVIGAVGSEPKAMLAKKIGRCHHVLVGYQDLGARAKALNKGRGVDVVYDGNGRDTFNGALDALRPRGLMVSFGNSSGPIAPFAPGELTRRGSLFFTRPGGGDYLADPKARAQGVRELFAAIRKKQIRVYIGQKFQLVDAPTAQAALEARATTGSSVLIP